MRGFVLWLFADLIFRLNNFIETIGFLLSFALIAPGHPFVAGRQHLSFILRPGIESLLFSSNIITKMTSSTVPIDMELPPYCDPFLFSWLVVTLN
jgi:hypothetical protein